VLQGSGKGLLQLLTTCRPQAHRSQHNRTQQPFLETKQRVYVC
jgi:hypothetical protein